MHTHHRTLFFFLLILPLQIFSQDAEIKGHWEGGISRMGSIQPIRIDFYQDNDSLYGTYDDPSCLLFTAPFFKLSRANDTLTINFGYGDFRCIFHKDAGEITGVNTRWNPKLDLHLRKYGRQPKPSFSREDFVINNGGVKIAASLLKPTSTGKYPVVVLVHGSDENVTRNTGYYYSLAYNLAEKGIGVLFYDKRVTEKKTGSIPPGFTALAADAAVCAEYIKKQNNLPITKVGLLGTSAGGWICYMAAHKTAAVQFVVANVGPAVSLYQQEKDRIQYSMIEDGMPGKKIDSALQYTSAYFDYVTNKLSWTSLKENISMVKNSSFADYLLLPEKENDPDVMWWRANQYDPAKDLSTLRCPVLAIMGGRDILVPPASNEALMRKYLLAAGVQHVIAIFPDAGHNGENFSTLKGGSWKFPENFWIWKKKAPGFYETITDWIKLQ